MDDKVISEVGKLKVSNVALENSIEYQQRQIDQQVTEMKAQIEAQNLQLQGAVMALNNANERIEEQKVKIARLEKSSHGGLQHGRGWNVEIDGIPLNVGDNPGQLQEAALKIFAGINVNVENYDIDTIHRLPSRNEEAKPTIVRFHSRKLVRALHENKNKLKNLNDLGIDIAGLNNDSKIYIRASQCPYFKNLSYNCRVLRRNGLIDKVNIGKDGSITIKTLDGNFTKVTHEDILREKFPDFQDFNFGERED